MIQVRSWRLKVMTGWTLNCLATSCRYWRMQSSTVRLIAVVTECKCLINYCELFDFTHWLSIILLVHVFQISTASLTKLLNLSFSILGHHWTKRQWGQEVTVLLVILDLAELNLHPRPCSRYSPFLCWKGALISQPTNRLSGFIVLGVPYILAYKPSRV